MLLFLLHFHFQCFLGLDFAHLESLFFSMAVFLVISFTSFSSLPSLFPKSLIYVNIFLISCHMVSSWWFEWLTWQVIPPGQWWSGCVVPKGRCVLLPSQYSGRPGAGDSPIHMVAARAAVEGLSGVQGLWVGGGAGR